MQHSCLAGKRRACSIKNPDTILIRFVPLPVGPYASPVYQHSGGHSNIDLSSCRMSAALRARPIASQNFKVSLGYRADFFFGAIDGGIDTRKSETLGFYGPFATSASGSAGRASTPRAIAYGCGAKPRCA